MSWTQLFNVYLLKKNTKKQIYSYFFQCVLLTLSVILSWKSFKKYQNVFMVGSRVSRFFFKQKKHLIRILWDINNVTISYALCIEKYIVYYVISFRMGWYEFRKPQRGNPRVGSHSVKIIVSVLKTLMVYNVCCFKQTLYVNDKYDTLIQWLWVE